MLFNPLAFLGLIPAIPVLAGQIPVVNGVIGGVRPTNPTTNKTPAQELLSDGATPPGKLRYVSNSGICETTPGVNQASGYIDLSSDKSIL